MERSRIMKKHCSLNILVTGGRAPATLHLIRLLAKNQAYKIFVADCVNGYLSKHSTFVQKGLIHPKPNKNKSHFKAQILDLIKQYQIHILIPTCEEIYHLSEIKKKIEELGCLFMATSYKELIRMHNKWEFHQICKTNNIPSPESSLNKNDIPFPMIAKGIYSRFGNQIHLIKNENDYKRLPHKDKHLYQQYINGTEICSYSLAYKGEVRVTTLYESKYKLTNNSPNICYHPIQDETIENLIKAFVKKINWSGQIGFDIIKTSDQKIYFIECNPRLTSGIFLIDELQIENGFLSGRNTSTIYAITSLLWILRLNNPFIKNLFRKKKKIKDCTWDPKDKLPYFAQYIFFIKNLFLMLLKRKKITQLLVEDIEWNGPEK